MNVAHGCFVKHTTPIRGIMELHVVTREKMLQKVYGKCHWVKCFLTSLFILLYCISISCSADKSTNYESLARLYDLKCVSALNNCMFLIIAEPKGNPNNNAYLKVVVVKKYPDKSTIVWESSLRPGDSILDQFRLFKIDNKLSILAIESAPWAGSVAVKHLYIYKIQMIRKKTPRIKRMLYKEYINGSAQFIECKKQDYPAFLIGMQDIANSKAYPSRFTYCFYVYTKGIYQTRWSKKTENKYSCLSEGYKEIRHHIVRIYHQKYKIQNVRFAE